MTDQNTPETPNPSELLDELRALGNNLRGLLNSAWASEERRRLQQELEAGLSDLKTTLNQAANEFQNSPTGQTIKEDITDFNQRLRTGEVEATVRREVLGALRLANDGLKKAADHLNNPPPPPTRPAGE